MKPEFDHAKIRCPKCNSVDTDVNYSAYEFYEDVEFCIDNTGHYYVDMYCRNCGHRFRAYFQFKYYIIEAFTGD